jgi:hypothetical protein
MFDIKKIAATSRKAVTHILLNERIPYSLFRPVQFQKASNSPTVSHHHVWASAGRAAVLRWSATG